MSARNGGTVGLKERWTVFEIDFKTTIIAFVY